MKRKIGRIEEAKECNECRAEAHNVIVDESFEAYLCDSCRDKEEDFEEI